jgi:hypothetical protein
MEWTIKNQSICNELSQKLNEQYDTVYGKSQNEAVKTRERLKLEELQIAQKIVEEQRTDLDREINALRTV